MWIMTPHGFVSIVEKPSDKENDTLTVRSRDARSLEYFANLAGITDFKATVKIETDYPFRVVATRQQVDAFALQALHAVRYTNFKNEAKAVSGKTYANALGRVWTAMLSLTPADVQKRADAQWNARWPVKSTPASQAMGPATASELRDRKDLLDEKDAWDQMDTYLDGLEQDAQLEPRSLSVGDLTQREWDAFVRYHDFD